MNYTHITTGVFLRRPNRFIAYAAVNNTEVICHVKNTGRLRELLYPGASILLEYHPDAAAQGRKTEYSLIGVYKETAGFSGSRQLINIDSQAPNRVAEEWLKSGAFSHGITDIKREVTYGNSRFDLAFTDQTQHGQTALSFMEVKGVTLESDGIARFPDAPTERGLKHVRELIHAAAKGHPAYIIFVIQMKGIRSFSPNHSTHPEFADALKEAAQTGVHILCYDCLVTEHSLQIDQPVKLML